MSCSIIGVLKGMMYKKVSRGAIRMSISKKKAGVILLIIAVIGFGYWLFHEDEVVPDFSSNNKIELIANVLENRNADKIREAGYGIPSDSSIRRLGWIDYLEIDGEVKLTVNDPSSNFEKMLVKSGIKVIKFYFSVSKEEQAARFESRKYNPLKQYKLSSIDQHSQQLWDKYTLAEYHNFKNTHSKAAPWILINSDDKKKARLNAIKYVLNLYDYPEKIDKEKLKLDKDIIYN